MGQPEDPVARARALLASTRAARRRPDLARHATVVVTDGRIYRVAFVATDGPGGETAGVVLVGVPHDQRGSEAVDSGPPYHDSFVASPARSSPRRR